MSNTTANQGKTNAIISHLWLIGLLIAIVLNTNKKNSFTSFYIRQMIGINLLIIANNFLIYNMIGSFIGWIVYVIILLLIFISLMSAINEDKKEVPIVGHLFQDWFKNF